MLPHPCLCSISAQDEGVGKHGLHLHQLREPKRLVPGHSTSAEQLTWLEAEFPTPNAEELFLLSTRYCLHKP